MAAEESPGQQGLSPQRHRELFGRFCRQKFHDGGRGCSKTVSSKKRDRIVRYLSNKLEADAVSPHFRFWVKPRGFQLVEMDGAQVLCLPNKQRVRDGPKGCGHTRNKRGDKVYGPPRTRNKRNRCVLLATSRECRWNLTPSRWSGREWCQWRNSLM